MNKAEKSAYNRAYGIANKERIAAKRAARRAGLGENIKRCSVVGCDGIYDSHGMCGKHYMAFRRNGDPTVVLQVQHHGKTSSERLEMHTKRGPDCWEWIGHRNRKGYGITQAGGKQRLAHRVAYELTNGPIPYGRCVLHRCDNPACIRLDHLFLGTLADNNADMDAKGRRRSQEAKLTPDMVREIRASTLSGYKLAREYGVSETAIRAVRNGRLRKHVKCP